MKIILNKDVVNLGEEGDIREVAPGYGRNYLIPRGLAVPYTKSNAALFEGRRKAIEKRKEEKRQQAVGMKERIEAMTLSIQVTAGETGRLFGSVNSATIMEELARLGFNVERKRIEVPDHAIKQTGNYNVRVKLYGNEVATLKVQVFDPNAPKKTEAAAGEATAVASAAGAEAPPAESHAPEASEAQDIAPEDAPEDIESDEDAE